MKSTSNLRMRSGIVAALLTMLALALPALAPAADPLGSYATYTSGLRGGTAFTGPFILNLTPGPEGNVWFVDNKLVASVPALGRITPSGEIKEYVSGTNLSGLNTGSDVIAIVAGPEGSKYLWFTDKGTTPAIGVVDSASPETAKEFSIVEKGGNAGSVPQGITVGSDNNLWFTDKGTTPAIGKVELSGGEVKKITECSAGLNAGSQPQGIVAGPDGNLWFTDTGTTAAIGKVNPGTCAIEEFSTGALSEPGGSNSVIGPWGIAPGPDGNVWFTEGGNNEANGKAVCRIKPAGAITCFKEGMIGTSHPTGLTAAGGKLWFTDASAVPEKQKLTIEATESLGGIYKLGYGGKETGATGTGNLLSSAKGKGTIKRWPTTVTNATCTRKTGSNELTGCNSEPSGKAEVGMRIAGTGIPLETLITKVEGTTITMSKAATSGGTGTSTTNINAGRVLVSETTSGKFELGQTATGTGITSGAIVSVEEKEGKVVAFAVAGTATSAGITSASGTATEPSASTTTVVTGVTNVTAFTKGETISGTGIPKEPPTTITAINTNLKTLTLSATPEAGTGVALSADLGYNASTTAIGEALEKLPGLTSGLIEVSGEGSGSLFTRTITFTEGLNGTDVEQLKCNGAGLTGVSASCSVTTTTPSVPNAIGSVSTSGAINRYVIKDVPLPSGATTGSDGNVWFAAGSRSFQKLGKFGTASPTKKLTTTKTGAGSGTVEVSPEGTSCGEGCYEEEEGSKVTLTAKASAGSEFREWSGACSGAGPTCEVTMSKDLSVNARFSHARPLLTLEKSGAGAVKSKPKGVACGNTCTKAVGQFYKGTSVVLAAKAVTGGALEGWTGCDSSTNTGLEGTCTVAMSESRKVKATFKAPVKPIVNPQVLSVAKAAGTGYGTVKATGLACELACTSTEVPYFGGEESPPAKKAKAPALVTLLAIPATGSSFSGWTGCESEPEGKCVVSMGKAQSVTARFEAKPAMALTLTKEGYGAVKSKPKGVACGNTCYSAAASLPEGTVVVLFAKAGTGAKFSSFVGCAKEVKIGELEATCEVTMSSAKAVKATFTAAPKAIVNPQTLTVTKAGTGTGTVKATGLACEAACTSTGVAYFGGEESPPAKKAKAPTLVTLIATPSAGSDTVIWSGCESEPEGKCVVSMGKAQSVTARFEE